MQHRVSDLFHLQMGKTPSRNQSEYWESGSNKWVSISDLSNCSMYTAEAKEAITDCAVRETNIRLVPKNTVIMSFKLSIGKTAITSEPVYTNEAIMAFINKDEELVLPEFLYYQLLSKDWGSAGNRAVMGTTLNKASLSQMKIYVPSLQKQQDIVQILSHIDSQLKKTNESVNSLNDLVKSRFVEMFGEAKKPRKDFPIKTLNDVCSSIVRGPFGSALKKEFFVPQGANTYKVYEQKHAIQKRADIGVYYISRDKFETLKRFECRPGDILMSCSGTMGKFYQLPPSCEPGVMNQALCKFTLSKTILNDYFLGFMEQVVDELGAKGSGIKNVSSVRYIKAIQVPLPPLELQRQFAAFVAQVDKLRFGACYAMYLLCAAFTLL